jgi:hypothetical protein
MKLARFLSQRVTGHPFRRTTLATAAAWLLLTLLLGACDLVTPANRPPAPTLSVPTAGAPLAQAGSPVAGPAANTATAPVPLQPAPTVTVVVPTAESPTPTSPACAYGWFFEPAPDDCPAGEPVTSAAAEEAFEGGTMVWLETSDAIIVFLDDGRWQRFEDTWSEGEPESDPALIPPEGRFQPIRGFGKLWRQQLDIRQSLGWAVGVELGFEASIQDQAPPSDRPPVTYLLTYNGRVVALVSRAADQGEWAVAADNR